MKQRNQKLQVKIDYPNKFDLIKRSTFGKPDLNHSFTSGETIKHILLFMFELKYLTKKRNNIHTIMKSYIQNIQHHVVMV